MTASRKWLAALAAVVISVAPLAAEPLSSWNDGAAKQSIVTFVNAVTQQGGKDFVPESERIAVFDNDGTLWIEQPIYVQFAFMLDQLRAAAPKHPEWQSNPAFNALVAQDKKALAQIGQKPVLELLATANSGMTVGEYDQSIRNWMKSARHPQLKRPYTELVYVPMQELLVYLRASGFKTFIVSGGSVEFMRPWAEQAYGIPAEQIIGSQQDVSFAMRDGKPVLMRAPKMFNLRTDPYERADITSNTYNDWLMSHSYLVVPSQALISKFLESFKEYPQRQKAASFNLDDVMRSMTEGSGSK